MSDEELEQEIEAGATICLLVHGMEGVGKSWLGQTTPSPRLVADCEGGSRKGYARRRLANGTVVKQKLIEWDPLSEEPPEVGEWDVAHVTVRSYEDVNAMYAWLNAGNHPFKSVVLDSLTEIQKRCKDAISGTETPTERDWGLLLIKMEHLVRAFRDLAFHPSNPLEAVVLLALTHEKSGRFKPAVQGALGVSLPGYVDVEGYLYVAPETEDEPECRRMLITPNDGYAAKDRTHVLSETYGSSIVNPDVEQMLDVLNSEEEGD